MTSSAATTLHDIMTHEVRSLPPQATLLDAARLMADERISSLIVMLDGEALGIVTESNILRALHARYPGETRLDAIMSQPLVMASPHLDLLSARKLLESHGIRHLVVAGNSGQVAGIVDAAHEVADLLGDAGAQVEHRVDHRAYLDDCLRN